MSDMISSDELAEHLASDPETLAASAAARVRSYCGWHIAPRITETITINGAGRLLPLPTLMLVDVQAVSTDGTDIDVLHCWWTEDGLLRLPFQAAKDRPMEITFTHGYESAPEDIISVVAGLVSRATSNPQAANQIANGPFSVGYGSDTSAPAAGLTFHQRSALDPYRLNLQP